MSEILDLTVPIDEKIQCPFCEKSYSKMGIGTHIWRNHGAGKNHNPFANYDFSQKPVWNKGLTKADHAGIARGAAIVSKMFTGRSGTPLTEEHKQLLSKMMTQRHADGLAWNIGKSRWNNEPSWPEKFFMQVIENEFTDKTYVREFPIGIYSLDFAWPHRHKCIEIDGEQHYRFADYIARDARKDIAIAGYGWQLLRIRWIDMYADTKYWIRRAIDFIELD